MHNSLKNLQTKLLIFFMLAIFILFLVISLNLNIHGDAKFHTLYAKESVESGFLVREQPHRIYNFDNGIPVYTPIAYPLTSESLFSILYLYGGETALKLYSPISATIIFLLVYLLTENLGGLRALSISFIATLSVGERLIMTPLMEPFIIVILLSALLLVKKYFEKNQKSYLFCCSLFLGSAVAIKQQGLILSLLITGFIGIYLLNLGIKRKELIKNISLYSIFLIFLVIIPLPALKDQINRTGTVAFAPGITSIGPNIPFHSIIQKVLSSKFTTDQLSMKAREETIFYRRGDNSFLNKLREYTMSPFLFYRSRSDAYYDSVTNSIYVFILFILITTFFTIVLNKKRHSDFFVLLLFFLLIGDLSASFVLKTPVFQYHSFGIIILTILFFYCLFKSKVIFKPYFSSISIVITVLFFSGYVQYVYPLWANSGREDDYHVKGYEKIGDYVQSSTPKDSIFLAAETSFLYYAKRDVVWLNESIGSITNTVVTTNNPDTALDNLKKVKASYIVINRDQTQRVGVFDYMPSDGLVSIVDSSPYFTKVFDPYGDGNMTVYKINYQK